MTKATECGGKQAHDTRRAAEDHRQALRRRIGIPVRLSVYRCQHCKKFHVGNRRIVGRRPSRRAA